MAMRFIEFLRHGGQDVNGRMDQSATVINITSRNSGETSAEGTAGKLVSKPLARPRTLHPASRTSQLAPRPPPPDEFFRN